MQRTCFRSLAVLVLGAVAAVAPAPSPGQAANQTSTQTAAQQANQPPVFKANVRTVIVNVVVTDRKGNPVEHLPQQDFSVTEDGRPQQITSFEEHTGAQPVVAAPLSLPPDVFTNIPSVKSTGALTVLLLDGLNTELQNQSYVRAQMLKYLQTLKPGRRVAIFALGNRLTFIQGFTDDPALLTAALKNLKRGSAPQSSAVLQSHEEIAADQQTIAAMSEHAAAAAAALAQFQAEQKASQTSLRVNMTLEAFQELAGYLAGIPGRKNVAWFSSAFPSVLFGYANLTDSFAVQNAYNDQIRKTDALLAAAQVSIYPIAAEGLAGDSLYDADQQAGAVVSGQSPTEIQPQVATAPPQQSAQIEEEKNALREDALQRNANHATMDDIARETGGKAIYNTNNLDDALGKVIDNGSYYYTLSYTPTDAAIDGRFRKVQVKVAPGNYNLAYRRGYYAADAKAAQAAATQPGADPLHPFMGPGTPDATQIPLALRVLRGATQPGGDLTLQTRNETASSTHAGDGPSLKGPLTRYTVDFVIARSGLELDPAPNGGRVGSLESTIVLYSLDGQPVNWTVRRVSLDMNAERYAAVEQDGVNFRLEIDAPKTAAFLRAGVYDNLSKQAGTLEIFLSSVTPTQAAGAAR